MVPPASRQADQALLLQPWWRDRLERTRARDLDTDTRLVSAGWQVVRVWEHEDPATAAGRVRDVVDGRRRTQRAG